MNTEKEKLQRFMIIIVVSIIMVSDFLLCNNLIKKIIGVQKSVDTYQEINVSQIRRILAKIFLINTLYFAGIVCFFSNKRKKIATILASQKNLSQILIILNIVMAFLVSALISGGSEDTFLRHKLESWVIILIILLLDAVWVKKSNLFVEVVIKYKKFFSENQHFILVITISLALRLGMMGTLQRWDAGEYYYKLGTACKNFSFTLGSFWNNFRLCGHGSMGFSLIMAIGEFLSPRNSIGVMVINLILTLIAIYCVYKLLKNYWMDLTSKKAAFLTFFISVTPVFLGTFAYVNVDYTMTIFFIFLLYSEYKGNFILMIFWSVMMAQTKETGILVAFGYYFFKMIYVFYISKEKMRSRLRRVIYTKELLAGVVTGFCILFCIFVQGGVATWGGYADNNSYSYLDDFSINMGYIIHILKQIFVVNFAWIVTCFLIISLIIVGIKNVKNKEFKFKNADRYIGLLGGVVAFVWFSIIYTRGGLYRYTIIVILGLNILFICIFCWGSNSTCVEISKRGIIAVLTVLFTIQAFWDIDIVSKNAFQRLDTGGVFGKLFTSYHSTYYGDGLVNNYQYVWIDKLFEMMLRDIEYSEKMDVIITGSRLDGTFIAGNDGIYRVGWDKEKGKRVIIDDEILKQTDIIEINVVAIFDQDEWIPKEQLRSQAVVFFLPYFDRDEEVFIKSLEKYYYIGERRKKQNIGGSIFYYELMKKEI